MEQDTIRIRIKFESGTEKFEHLEFYYGSVALLGLSQILNIALTALISDKIITHADAKVGFNLSFKRQESGSLWQDIALFANDPETISILKDYGKNAVYDFLKWALASGIGLATYTVKNRKAIKAIRSLRKKNKDLEEKLEQALARVHSPVKNQGLEISLYVQNREVVRYDASTLNHIETEIIDKETKIINVAVSRFNARTANGRFIQVLDGVSIPFEPVNKLSQKQMSILAANLYLVTRHEFSPIEVLVSEVRSASGRLKRYRLHKVLL